MNTINKIDEVNRKRRELYYDWHDKNLIPDTVYLGRKEYKDLLINPEIKNRAGLMMNINGDKEVLGLKVITVNMDSHLAVACTSTWREE